MISVNTIHKWYASVHALRGVSFELGPGQVAGLLGPNGAGKSTTIKLITGMVPPDSGSISILGHDTLASSIKARASIGYLPESAPLYPEMSVQSYLAFRAGLLGIGAKARRHAIEHALERCWLKEVRHRRIGHLSKGYRQRAGLASAILNDPPVLILDEPTNGLDPTQIAQMRTLVQELGQDRTMLISSHILPEIQTICSRILIIAGGSLRADGSPQSLIDAHAGQRSYLIEARAQSRADNGPDSHSGDRIVALRDAWLTDPRIQSVASETLAGEAGWQRLTIRPRESRIDIREFLAASCAHAGLDVRELSVRSATLEDVFMKLTSGPSPSTPEEAA
ncbi:ABC transporter ATP-binding protein [Nodularia spumigena]|uniref:ABC transporter ATP-binding protein n=1 Tax=Nodularia spumigena TaxID=70799 RepID=UPI002B1EDA5D|nr:ATP-binding cassette domain-containing protein [Nodularia spumigena]MEA5557621.1 ATP-binding cassette domain-containing protein [Nodularia spumigena CH309]